MNNVKNVKKVTILTKIKSVKNFHLIVNNLMQMKIVLNVK